MLKFRQHSNVGVVRAVQAASAGDATATTLTHELVVELHASAQVRGHALCNLVPRGHTWAGSSEDATGLKGRLHSGDFCACGGL